MKISVVGLWRDSEKYAKETLESLENIVISNPEIKFDFYFYENDSKDNTKQILSSWIEKREGDFYSEDKNFPRYGSVPDPNRVMLLSYYRNRIKDLYLAKTNSDYTLFIDTDTIFTNNDFSILLSSIRLLNCGMVVANTRQNVFPDFLFNKTEDSFYDSFAFRDKLNNPGLYFTDCPFILEEDRNLWLTNMPIQILSGFGGFSLVETDLVRKCKWSTIGNSEHVNFCCEINNYKKIYMIPECKPLARVDISGLNPSLIAESAKKQISAYNIYNSMYQNSTAPSLELG